MKRLTCLRCSHAWYQRAPRLPKHCPGGNYRADGTRTGGCGSPYWRIPRTLRGHLEAVAEGDPTTLDRKGETP